MKRDCETGGRLINPFIEIGRAGSNKLDMFCQINAVTFKAVSGDVRVLPFPDSSPVTYEVFASVSGPMREDGDYSGVNPSVPMLVRHRLGYLEAKTLKKELPRTYAELNPDEESDAERDDFMPDSQEVGDLAD